MKKYSKILSLLLVLSILISPFAGTLNNIAVAEGEETPFIFDAETGTITGYKDGNPPADLQIPAEINGVEVKHIGDKAFYYSQYGGTIKTQLNSVELPEGLESLGYMAFQKNNFTEVKLPSTLTTLGQRSLAYNKLTTINFPENLTSIGKEAFQENEFTEIEIPSHIEEIGEGAFKTNKIEKVVLHDGLKTIGAKAFEDNLIEEIEIPDTVENWPSINKDNSIFRRNGNGTGTLYLAKVYNNSGATPKNTFGIVNPASVTIEYKDINGEEIKPSKTIVGKELKIAKKEGSAIVAVGGSGEDLLTYNVDKDIGYKLIEVIDEISENYYQVNKEYTFEPEEIEGYTRPDEKIVTLNDRENIISFIYEKEGQEPTGPEADLRRAADMLKVTVKNTDIELTSPVTDNKWIKLVDYDKGGDYLISISWESSNEALIKIDEDIGYITLPEEGEEEVRLTATLSKSGHELKKHFDYVLTKNKPEETEDEKYIGNAVESLEWFRLNLNSDVDKNVKIHMEDALKKKGFEGIDVSIKSSDKPEYIGLDGNINYIFAEEYLKSGLPYNRQVALILEFSKGEAKKDFSICTVVGWDRNKVRHAIEKNIIEPMGEDLVGANEGFHKIKEDFEVPTRKEYTTISWESSDNNILRVEPSSVPLSPSNIIVNRASVDKEVDLTCKIKFNHDDIELEKKYSLTVLALDNEDDIREEMQKLLDANYTVEKLKDFTNKKPINADDVRHDIQLIIPRNTGIKDYFNYEFKVTSDNEAVVINNNPISYRANVYRPLPEEEAVDVNLSVNMRHKEKDITVSKIIPIKVTALSQKEIDDEIQLMKLVKENYFQGIKGDNIKITEITKDLKPFREANLIDGELVWTRHINDDRNTGIYPDEIEGWENQEQWRLFKSSNPEVVTHENLLVIKPKHNTDVKIESTLSSKVYGKYAERYPNREEFQKLYRQDVSAIVTVIGEEDLLKPAKIELSFPGGKQVSPLYPGGKQIINAKVLNRLGEEIKGEKVIFESSNPNVLKHSFMDTFTAGKVEEETEVTITAKLESNPEIISSIKVIVTPKTEENVIVTTINEIKPYLDGQTGHSYNYLLSMGMIHNGEPAGDIKQKMYIRDNYTSASELAENIMTLVAVGEDPTNYKGKNFVNELIDSQQKDGNFKLGYTSPSDKDLMMSIIALDMYEDSIHNKEALYNKETAINLLVRKAKKDGTKYYYELKNSTEGDNIERSSLGLIALSNYQDDPEVMEVIGGIKRYFKSRQYKDGNIEGFKYNGDPQFRASSTASVIQSLMAIGDNPLEEEWVKNNKTMLDGLLKFRTSKGFAATEGGMTDTKATINAFAALTDLKNEKSMYGEVTKGEEQDPDLNKPYSIRIKFEGGKTISEIEEGSELGLIAEVLNEDNQVLKDERVNWEVSNKDILEYKEPNKFIAKKVEEKTEVTITAVSQTDNTIKASIKINVVPKEQKPIIPVNLDEEIDFLKQCYEAYMTEDSNGNTGNAGLSMLAPGAARLAGMDVENIQKHLYIDEDNKSAYQLSQSIITLIGADLDPRQYKDKGKVRNLVKELVDSQQVDGENKGEFIKADSDKNSIESLARSIIALDMARAKYDEESAVSKLMEIYDKKDSHTYKDIKTEGIVLVALSNHKDIDGVEVKVNEILNYLKTKQNEDGGFDIEKGWEKGKNSPTATGRVIQGLIANGINPLENEEWIKNGSTMLNAIVRSKTVKENMKHSGYGKGEEDEYTYYEATYTAFGALMDLKNQKSMFELLKLEVDIDAEAHRVEIIKPDKNQIEVGQSLALTAKVYDKDGKVLQGQELIWESSDEGILTVKDGNIEAKSAGEATITVKVKGTEIQDTLEIIVINEVKTLEVNTAIIVFNKDGKYEIKSNPQKVTINKDEHNGGFTVFGALQATTSEYEANGDWVNSIYGISEPEKGGWMFTVNGKVPNTSAGKVKLNEDDKVIWFCTYDYNRDKAPSWSELTGQEPEEELSIKIISNKQSIKVGEELPLTAEVRQGDKVLNDKEIMWLSSNAEIATIDENAKLTGHKAGQVTITAALAEDKEIKDTIKISVVAKDKEDLTIEEVIKELRGYYSNKDEFTFRQAIGYNHTSDNLEKDLIEIGSKFKTNEDPKTASEHVGNIMGLIAAGKDPYNHNNKNYVETLVKAQNEEGKFIIGQYDDYPTTVAFSMLALDMADANYNRDKAIKALLGYQKDDGSFGGVDETGMVLTALGKYKDKSEVQTAINKGLKYLKGQQDENTGGFIVWGGENPYSASAVLQGLIAVGENPQSEKWTKGGKTIVDSLMNFYKDGHFEYTSEWGKDIDMPTEQAFAALADVYRGKSMFNEIKLNTNEVAKITIDVPEIDKIIEGEIVKLYVTGYDNENNIVPVKEIEWTSSHKDIAEVDKNGQVATKKPGKVTIIATVKGTNIKDSIDLEIHEKEFEIEYIGDTEVKNGEQVNAKVRLNNLTGGTKSATLIVGLYNKNTHKLLNYSIVKKELKGEEKLELAAGFLVPETGEYYIRAFLWDDLEVQNIIMQEAKDIQVAN